MNAEELRAKVESISPWFYEMDLGHGIRTPGQGPLDVLNQRANVYFDMGVKGMSVLDVGAWDGFYSFEAERRGASRVLAVDKFCWGGGGGNRNAFLLAREALGSSVEDKLLDIPETTVDSVGQFDVVLFNGIIYHIKDPLHAIGEMARITRHVLSIETHMDLRDTSRPSMVYYPGEKAEPGNPQNGWGINSYLGHALLKSQGFETVLEFATPDIPERRSIFLAFKPGHPYQDFVRKHAAAAQPRLKSTGTSSTATATAANPEPSLAAIRLAVSEALATAPVVGWRAIAKATFTRLAAYFR